MFQRMVPPKFSTHEDCREAVCCCCGVKTDKKRISVREEALVVEFAKKEYDSKVQSYPAGLCLNCRRNLFQCAKNKKDKVDWDWIGRAHPKLLWDNFELSTERYDPCTHSDVTCTLCQVARYNPIGRKKVSKFAKPKLGAKGEPIVQPKTRVSPKKICPKCMAETGPGLPHSQSQCTSKSAKKNIVEMIAKESVCEGAGADFVCIT